MNAVSTVNIDSIDATYIENTRLATDSAAQIKDLATSIEREGLLEPLVVRAIKGGRYGLLAGFRRLTALRSLGVSDVPVHILTGGDPANDLHATMAENGQRRDLTWPEQALTAGRVKGQPAKVVASLLGLGHASRVSQLARLAASPGFETICQRVKARKPIPGIAQALDIVARCAENGRDPALAFARACEKLDEAEGAAGDGAGGKGKGKNEDAGEGDVPTFPVLGARKIWDVYEAIKAEPKSEERDYCLSVLAFVTKQRKTPPHGIKLPERKPGRKAAEVEENEE